MPEEDRVDLGADVQDAKDVEFQQRYQYAVKSKMHMWLITLSHYADDKMLDDLFGESLDIPVLDSETMAVRPAVACFVCEATFNPLMQRRKCTGEPKQKRSWFR